MSEPQQGTSSPWQSPAPERQHDQQVRNDSPQAEQQQAPPWSSVDTQWPPTPAAPPAPAAHPWATPPGARKGWAIAAVVVGGVAVLLSWVPLVNLLAVLGGVAAVALGIVGIVFARRPTHAGKALAITGIAAGAAAVVIALIIDTVLGLRLVEQANTVSSSSAAASDPAPAPLDPTTPAPDDDTPSTPAPDDTSALALALGETVTLGDYTVAVTAVNENANDVIAQVNQFNPAPSGQYVLVDVAVVYNGTAEGTPWVDLDSEYLGTDARNYRTSTCSAVLPQAGYSQPTLRQGGTAGYQMCFDLPADAIAGGAIGITSGYSADDPEAFWQVDGAGSASGV